MLIRLRQEFLFWFVLVDAELALGNPHRHVQRLFLRGLIYEVRRVDKRLVFVLWGHDYDAENALVFLEGAGVRRCLQLQRNRHPLAHAHLLFDLLHVAVEWALLAKHAADLEAAVRRPILRSNILDRPLPHKLASFNHNLGGIR